MLSTPNLINNPVTLPLLRDTQPILPNSPKNKKHAKIPRPTCSRLAPAHPDFLLSKRHLSSSQSSYFSLLFSSLKCPSFIPPKWRSVLSMAFIPLSFSLLIFLLLILLPPHLSACNERCGDLFLPFPFHLNSSCGPKVDAFRLICTQSSFLYLTIGLTDLRIISFLTPTSILIDYSKSKSKFKFKSSPCDRWYADLNGFSVVLNQSAFFSVTADNVLRLYDCDDSSVCRSGCERVGGCAGALEGCCYPLWDGSVWEAGEGFGAFGEYGCRGFSSWVEKRGVGGDGRRGIEVEWAVPRRLVEDVGCAEGAVMVNATVVKEGYRCACSPGLVGDGFARGNGCFKGDFLGNLHTCCLVPSVLHI